MSEQKYTLKRPKLVTLTSCSFPLYTLPNSSRISNNSRSCVSEVSKSPYLLKELEELLAIDVLLIILGKEVAILEELSFSSFINKDFIFSRSI